MANIVYDSNWRDKFEELEEQLKQQITDKPADGAMCVGEVQIKNGKFFFVTQEKTYPLESIDQIKKIAAKILLKKKPENQEDSLWGIKIKGKSPLDLSWIKK